jgi:polyphosphate kinase
MHRNLDRRVEAIVPIKDSRLRQYIKEEILDTYAKDTVNAQLLNPDGTYRKIAPDSKKKAFDSQMYFVGKDL